MENNPLLQFLNCGFVLIISLLIYSPFCVGQVRAQAKPFESKNSKQRQIIHTECLEDKPKPLVIREFGMVNKYVQLMPRPEYPPEAIRKSISGEVKAEIVINLNSGMIDWAKIQSGDPILQEAVRKVVCGVRFYPINDVNVKGSGFLIYRFKLPRHSAQHH